MNYTRPQLAVELEPIKKAFLDAKSRGVKLRYLTEITKDNLTYCKKLISVVDELRHLDCIKGNFMLSESEYLAPVILFEKGKIASEIICSNLKDLVDQQQYIFDNFWNRGIPGQQKIREIEGDISALIRHHPAHYETKVLENQEEIFKNIQDLIETSDELLVCSDFDGMQMIYNSFFDSYKRLLDKCKNGGHKGIRWIGTIINKDIASDLIELFEDAGVQVRHVKTILPINFVIGGKKELHATIEYAEGGNSIQSLLISNDPAYINHFTSVFEELWKNSLIL